MKIEFDVNSFTLGEAEDIEEYTGMTLEAIGSLLQAGSPPMKVVTALVWIAGRREDPAFTVAQARGAKMVELELGDKAKETVAARGKRPNAGAAARQ